MSLGTEVDRAMSHTSKGNGDIELCRYRGYWTMPHEVQRNRAMPHEIEGRDNYASRGTVRYRVMPQQVQGRYSYASRDTVRYRAMPHEIEGRYSYASRGTGKIEHIPQEVQWGIELGLMRGTGKIYLCLKIYREDRAMPQEVQGR